MLNPNDSLNYYCYCLDWMNVNYDLMFVFQIDSTDVLYDDDGDYDKNDGDMDHHFHVHPEKQANLHV